MPRSYWKLTAAQQEYLYRLSSSEWRGLEQIEREEWMRGSAAAVLAALVRKGYALDVCGRWLRTENGSVALRAAMVHNGERA